MNKKITFAISALSFTLLSSYSNAALIAYEPFTGSGVVAGSGSGTGWDGNWSGAAGITYGAGNSFTDGTSTIVSSGNVASLTGGADISRSLATATTVDATNTTAYYSFLLSNPGPVAAGHEFRVSLTNGGADIVSFGKDINAFWRLTTSGGIVDFTTNTTNSNIGNWLAVVELSFNGTDTVVTGYLAEDSDAGLDVTSTSTFLKTGSSTISGAVSFDGVAIDSHNTSSALVDEIRIGNLVTDVIVVPEPSSTALLGLGGIALILRRRK